MGIGELVQQLPQLIGAAVEANPWLGYGAIFAAMFLENLFPPIPSELIMPLGGFYVQQGQLALRDRGALGGDRRPQAHAPAAQGVELALDQHEGPPLPDGGPGAGAARLVDDGAAGDLAGGFACRSGVGHGL